MTHKRALTLLLIVAVTAVATGTPPLSPADALPPWPATAPVLEKDLSKSWDAWRAALKADDAAKLDEAEGQLAALAQSHRGDELRPLLAVLAAEYQAFAQAEPRDAHGLVRLEYLAGWVASTCCSARNLPQSITAYGHADDARAVEAYVSDYKLKRQVLREAAEWYVRLVEDGCRPMPPKQRQDAAARVFGFMPAGTFFLLPWAEDMEQAAGRLEKLKPQLAELAKAAPEPKRAEAPLKLLEEMLPHIRARGQGVREVQKLLGMADTQPADAADTEVFSIEMHIDADALKNGTYPRGTATISIRTRAPSPAGQRPEQTLSTRRATWAQGGWRLD